MTDQADPNASSIIEPGAYLKSIIDSAEDVIISKSLTGHIESWNPAAERLFGYTPREVLGQPISILIPPERMHEEETILARIARGERVEHFETVRRCKSGRLVNLSVTISPIFDGSGRVVGASHIARDITERLRVQKIMWLQANYDTLTGMPQRRIFEDDLQKRLSTAGGDCVGVLVIGLDHLKQVNDALGRQAGDQVIAQVAGRIREEVRHNDLVARFGGDEFGVALFCEHSAREIGDVARRLLHVVKEPISLGTELIYASASVGIAVFPGDGDDARTLVEKAELAVNDAKRSGGGGSQRFSQALEAEAQQRLKLASDLRLALQRDELFLLYQPVVELQTRRIGKCEALLRWRHPDLGLVPPPVFIAIAEQTGLIHDIGDWIFQHALEQLATWRREIDPNFQISINMSPAQLVSSSQPGLDWMAELQRVGVPARSIIVEVTESMMLVPELGRSSRLAAVRRGGFDLAIDDFGTGYSSLAQLSRLDANYLKIDQSFVRGLRSEGKDLILCRAIVAMAHALGLVVVAEGIETLTQLDLLVGMGCDYGQGYLFSRPVDAAELRRLALAGALC